jgi:hypothetical protein
MCLLFLNTYYNTEFMVKTCKKQSFLLLFLVPLNIFWGRDSSVGIATGYGMDGSGHRIPVEGEIFRTHPESPWGPPRLLYNGYRVFSGVKRSGPSQERVELYFYPPLGLQICYVVSLPLPFTFERFVTLCSITNEDYLNSICWISCFKTSNIIGVENWLF